MQARTVGLLALTVFVSSSPGFAQEPVRDTLGRSTPKGAVLGFVAATHPQSGKSAADFLNTPLKGEAAANLASQLSTVLDRLLPANLDKLSDKPEGSLDDGLNLTIERVGAIQTADGPMDILLERVHRNGDWIWLFSGETLKRIPEVFDDLDTPSINAYVPKVLARKGWLSVAVWKWLAILACIALAAGVSGLLQHTIVRMLRPAVYAISKRKDDELPKALAGPLRALVLLMVVSGILSLLMLPLIARSLWSYVASGLYVIVFAWLFLRLVRIAGELMRRRMEVSGQADRTAVIRLVQRTINVLAVFVVIVLFLRSAGYDVSAALAGLGVGGLAIAFAAQKTLENLFGGVSVIFDKPIRVGDFCRIGDRSGTVEDIGLRSTRVRTPDRTVLTIPNGQLSAMNLENFSLRDKILFKHSLGVRYETKTDQLRFLLAELRRTLYAHPMVEHGTSRVRLTGYSASSVDFEIFAYVLTTDAVRFLEVQEDLLLRVRDVVDLSGTGFAFPSSVTYAAQDQALDEGKTAAAIQAVQGWREKKELPFPDFPAEQIAAMRNGLAYPDSASAIRETTL